MNVTGRRLVPALVAILALAACKSDSDKAADAAADSAGVATQPAANTGPKLSEPQVAMAMLAANAADSAGGLQALDRSGNPDVRNYGQTMVTDHTNMNREATDLNTRLQVAPEATDMSRQLKESHDRAAAELGAKTGADFDRAYIQHEVTMHGNLIAALDQQMIPAAQNPELKALLQKIRPAVQAHLDRAKLIQQRLNAAAAAPPPAARIAPPAPAAPPTTTTGGT